jgi:hypothetical protein
MFRKIPVLLLGVVVDTGALAGALVPDRRADRAGAPHEVGFICIPPGARR